MRIDDAETCPKTPATARGVRLSTLAVLLSAISACTAQTVPECPESLVVASPTARSCVYPSNPTRESLVGWMDCVLTAFRLHEPLETANVTTRISNGLYLPYVILRFEGGARSAVGPCPRLVVQMTRPGSFEFECGTPEFNLTGAVVPFPTQDQLTLASTTDVEAALFSGDPIVIDSPDALGPFAEGTCVSRQLDVSTQPSACGSLVPSAGGPFDSDVVVTCGDAAAE